MKRVSRDLDHAATARRRDSLRAMRTRSSLVVVLGCMLAASCGGSHQSAPGSGDGGRANDADMSGGGSGGGTTTTMRIGCSFDTQGQLCSCVVTTPTTTEAQTHCSAASIGLQPAACCADKDWPHSGSCACSGIWCGQLGSGPDCTCALADSGNGDTTIAANACTATACCAAPGFDACSCQVSYGPEGCGSSSVKVSACGTGAICAPDHVAVTSCY
jgi:hypothetical protein